MINLNSPSPPSTGPANIGTVEVPKEYQITSTECLGSPLLMVFTPCEGGNTNKGRLYKVDQRRRGTVGDDRQVWL